MALYQPVWPKRYVQPLIDLLHEQDDASLAALLAVAAGDASDTLDAIAVNPPTDHDRTLTSQQVDALLTAATQTLNRSDLGFALGERISIDSHAALGPVLRSCTTTDELLRTVSRYWRLITTSFTVSYQRDGKTGEFWFLPATGGSQTMLHAMEELFAVSFHSDYARLLGREHVLDIYLSMPQPKHINRYRKLTPTRFHFGAHALPGVCCIVPKEALYAPIHQSAARGTKTTEAASATALDDSAVLSREYGDWVSLMLREANGIQPSLKQLAALQNMGARSLTRALANEGLNFREMANQIRLQRARKLLSDSSLSVAIIAQRLGYSSAANFSSAFMRVAGLSPRDYRNKAKSQFR